MTIANLKSFVKGHPTVQIDVDKNKLVFHKDPQRRWRILKLLDDDYLHSQLTQLDYESNSKAIL